MSFKLSKTDREELKSALQGYIAHLPTKDDVTSIIKDLSEKAIQEEIASGEFRASVIESGFVDEALRNEDVRQIICDVAETKIDEEDVRQIVFDSADEAIGNERLEEVIDEQVADAIRNADVQCVINDEVHERFREGEWDDELNRAMDDEIEKRLNEINIEDIINDVVQRSVGEAIKEATSHALNVRTSLSFTQTMEKMQKVKEIAEKISSASMNVDEISDLIWGLIG